MSTWFRTAAALGALATITTPGRALAQDASALISDDSYELLEYALGPAPD